MSRRKNAGQGYGYDFHGAYANKADAVEKESKTKGSFIKGRITPRGYRYIVMTPRKNPRKVGTRRRKRANPEDRYRVAATRVEDATRHLDRVTAILEEAKRVHLNKAAIRADKKVLSIARRQLSAAERQLAKEAGRRQNPAELLVMGANPGADDHYMHEALQRLIAEGLIGQKSMDELTGPELSRVAMRAAEIKLGHPERRAANPSRRQNVEFGEFDKGVFHPWTRRPRTRRKPAVRRRGSNPSAEELHESFTGMPLDRIRVAEEPHMPAGDYAQLGKLLALYVKPKHGGQVLHISFTAEPILVADESERLWFVGGSQHLDPLAFGARSVTVADRRDGSIKGVFELGEVRRIDYKQRKPHLPHADVDEWRHEFGEETGVLPVLLYDAGNRRLLLEGGAYRIRPEGIIN